MQPEMRRAIGNLVEQQRRSSSAIVVHRQCGGALTCFQSKHYRASPRVTFNIG
jgi:hypothetical protein